MRMRWMSVVVLAVSMLMVGCGGAPVKPANYGEEAQAAYERAERALERGEYEGARNLLTEISEQFAMSPYGALAEYRLGDLYFEEGSYLLAADAYRRFAQKRPTHAKAEEAELAAARCAYQQMPGEWFVMPPAHERELVSAKEAYGALTRFVKGRPDSTLRPEADRMLGVVTDRLAAHELYVGKFYLDRSNALAAARRLSEMLTRYPTSGLRSEGRYLLARSYLLLGDGAAAVSELERLVAEDGGSEWGAQAAAYLRKYRG